MSNQELPFFVGEVRHAVTEFAKENEGLFGYVDGSAEPNAGELTVYDPDSEVHKHVKVSGEDSTVVSCSIKRDIREQFTFYPNPEAQPFAGEVERVLTKDSKFGSTTLVEKVLETGELRFAKGIGKIRQGLAFRALLLLESSYAPPSGPDDLQ